MTLLKLLIDPPDSWLAGLGSVSKPALNLEKVIEILNKYAVQIATPDVLKVLPDEIPIQRISDFLVIALDKAIGDRRLYQVNRGLLYAKLLKVKIIIILDVYKVIISNIFFRFNSREYSTSHKILL